MASAQFEKLVGRLHGTRDDGPVNVTKRRAVMGAVAFPVADDISVESATIGGVPAEWIAAPGADPTTVIFYIHGGGFCLGSPHTYRKLAGDLSRAANARLLLLDYPLAPESPFPAGLNALVAAYVALIAVMAPTRIVVGGDSAGGGLVMSLLLALRDRAVALPAGAVCISPWVDLIRAEPADPALASLDPIVSPGDLLAMRSLYADGCDFTDPLLSPGFADLKGLPPLLIHVGAAEVLLPDSHQLAKRASVDGVDVKLEVWPDMVHVWHVFAGRVPEATEAVEGFGRFVRDRVDAT